MRILAGVGDDPRLPGDGHVPAASVHHAEVDVGVGGAAERAVVSISNVGSPLDPDRQRVRGACHLVGFLRQEGGLELLLRVLRHVLRVSVQLAAGQHSVDVHVARLHRHILIRRPPELLPILLEHLKSLLLAVNDYTPLGQVCDVEVLGANIVGKVIDNEELGVVARLAFVLPITLATTSPRVRTTEVYAHQASQSLLVCIWEVLLNFLDDLRRDVFARPAISVVCFRHVEICRNGARAAEAYVHIDAALIDGTSKFAQVVLWPNTSRDRHRTQGRRHCQGSQVLQGHLDRLPGGL
mmetsp:Transcript_155084/g.497229  ORF Transcript_155084/g.497229 Transcript_155084/m.497229 type:complete len:296 (-) Transcript_155084:1098-1985(-)